jgi:hypothetical protein
VVIIVEAVTVQAVEAAVEAAVAGMVAEQDHMELLGLAVLAMYILHQPLLIILLVVC